MSALQQQIAWERRLANLHYRTPHTRCVFPCPECGHHVGHFLYRWSSVYFPPRDIRKMFTVRATSIRTPVVEAQSSLTADSVKLPLESTYQHGGGSLSPSE